MGIGRFAFTPLLPMMLHDGVIELPAASWLATANYVGYWLGAPCTSLLQTALGADGGLLFLGRSDATLKPAGVRVATADLYAALPKVPAVRQALAVGYVPSGATAEKVVLFVVLDSSVKLTAVLEAEIRETLRRSNAFYAPALIVQAPEVPRTSNNKLSELSVKRILKGEDPGNYSALANPECLEFFKGEAVRQVKGALG
jgi:acyl-CoA synthetase (AMP-forming)/AMP-acid ligase II